jgi:hypothetical protein
MLDAYPLPISRGYDFMPILPAYYHISTCLVVTFTSDCFAEIAIIAQTAL